MRVGDFWGSEDGITTVEYALLLALIVVAGLAVWSQFAATVRNAVASAKNAIEAAGT
ncbi:MAG: Flp family type IVb pilin [Armatimonadetes bacterium]|nr:Flp family type IVb pilin [Armatimonadota bacterium]